MNISTRNKVGSVLLVLIGLMLPLGLLVWPVLAYNFSNRFRLSTNLPYVTASPDIAAAGDYVAAVWSEGYNGDSTTKEFGRVYLKSAHRVDGWEARLPVFAATTNGWGKDPKVTFDPSDSSRVHVVWAQADSCAGGGNPLPCKWRTIKYTTCTLNGVDSCAPPQTVYTTSDASDDYSTPDVAVDASGNVYVVWRRSSPTPARLMYRKKPSGGSFSGGGDITGTDGGRNPALVFVDGRLHLVWDAGNSLKYQRNSALGNVWSSDQSVSWNPPTGYQDPSFPAIEAGSSNALYVVWAVQSASNSQQYALAFDFSQNGASWQDAGGDGLGIPDKTTFTPFKSAKGSAVSYLESLKPDVAVTGSGTSAYAHVVWHGTQSLGSIYNVRYTYLAGIGASNWSAVTNVSSSGADSGDPAIAMGAPLDETHVAFMEDADASNSDVWYMGANGNRENDGDAALPAVAITLNNLQKDGNGISSRYVVTNTGTSTASTVHDFYDDADVLVTSEVSTIPSGESRTYDLATIVGLPDGYMGYVIIQSDEQITGTVLTPPEPTYSISGQVTDNAGNPIPEVMVKYGEDEVFTDDNGGYYITGLPADTYTLVPSKSGYTFSPLSRTVSVPPSITGQNFTASIATGISVEDIQVVQVTLAEIDLADNQRIPLIQDKSTLVRVYVTCEVVDCHLFPASLHAYGSSGELPGSPQTSFSSRPNGFLGRILTFWMPFEWETGEITLVAELSGATGSKTVTFHKGYTLNILYVPVNLKGNIPDTTRIKDADMFARKVYPASDLNYIRLPAIPWNPAKCPKTSTSNADCLMIELHTLYDIKIKEGYAADFIFGWLPKGSESEVGYAGLAYANDPNDPRWNYNGRTAFGVDKDHQNNPILDLRNQRTFAHEVGHLLLRHHTNTVVNLNDDLCLKNPKPKDPHYGGTDEEWKTYVDIYSDWVMLGTPPLPPPFPNSKIQKWGIDTALNLVKDPANTYDYMSYCALADLDRAWTSPWTYNHIYMNLETLVGNQAVHLSAVPRTYFIASGLVADNDTAAFNPIWIIDSVRPPANPPIGMQYCLEAQNASGTPLTSRCFDLSFINPETQESTDVAGFYIRLPYPSGVARIVLKKGATELAIQPVSANAPVVDVISPNGGETWAASGTQTIIWRASDVDGDQLRYMVEYSPDGSDWTPLGMTEEIQLTVDVAELAGGNRARVRVLATDGVNTSTDESDSPFVVGRKGPQARILSPESDSVIPPGTPLFLEGSAYDLEDGTLEDGRLRWSSNRTGDLRTGGQVLVTLPQGHHIITLTATDSDGNVATDSLNIFVGNNKIYLPIILK